MRRFFLLAFLVVSLLTSREAIHQPPTIHAAPEDKMSQVVGLLSQRAAANNLAPDVATRGVQVGVSPSGGGSLQMDGVGRVLVIMRVSNTSAATQSAIGGAGASIYEVSTRYNTITAYVAPGQLVALAGLNQVLNIREALRPGTDSEDMPAQAPRSGGDYSCSAPSGNFISQGNAQLNVNTARTTYSVTGAGVLVGVESDSYNQDGSVPSATTEISTDDLPGPGNPCGFPSASNILADPPGGIDEGRAMMGIVHDLAPGAPMAFAGPLSETDFASRLTTIQGLGAKVFSDDLNFFEDPFFQEGPIGVAAGNAKAAGMLSFTSAGNMNGTSGGIAWNGYESSAYRPTGCPAGVPAGHVDCHSFGTGGSPDATYGFTIAGNFNARPILQWAEPRFGVTTDLDLYIMSGSTVLASSASTNTGGAGTQLPYEFAAYQPGVATAVNIVIARKTGSIGTPRLKIIFFRTGGSISAVEYTSPSPGDSVGHMIMGHHCSPNFISMAATSAASGSTSLESYSGIGPCNFYFGPVLGSTPAGPIAMLAIPKPDVVATDCVNTGVAFFAGNFCGTSASSPHGAAIAALLFAKVPSATPTQVQNAMVVSAVAMAGGANAVGAGRLDANAALGFLTGGSGSSPNWVLVPGGAREIAAGQANTVYALGTAAVPGGSPIYQYVGPPSSWSAISGAAEVLAVDNAGSLWALQNTNSIYHRISGTWTNIPGSARDLTASNAPNSVFALGTAGSGNYPIYQYVGGGSIWANIPGAAAQLASASDGSLWARQSNNAVYRYSGGSWTSISGAATLIAAGGGQVYALSTTPTTGGFLIYKYVGGATVWRNIPGGAVNLAVDNAGTLWALQDAAHGNAIYKCTSC